MEDWQRGALLWRSQHIREKTWEDQRTRARDVSHAIADAAGEEARSRRW